MDTNSIIITSLIASNLLLLVWLIRIEFRLRRVFGGKRASELETVCGDIQDHLKKIEATHSEIKRRVSGSEERLSHTVRNVKTIRFNPFTDQGSNQSFATAFVDDHGDGVVLSSLYSRERVSVFAKPITKGKSTYELTDEEAQIVKQAYEYE